mmetsp:Transcript_37311/g.105268  ORF Transcript_37311/g.105268 Transcript_37311/m.105268 type:complete len:252 (-) Transcript_37311:3452-4207(-)
MRRAAADTAAGPVGASRWPRQIAGSLVRGRVGGRLRPPLYPRKSPGRKRGSAMAKRNVAVVSTASTSGTAMMQTRCRTWSEGTTATSGVSTPAAGLRCQAAILAATTLSSSSLTPTATRTTWPTTACIAVRRRPTAPWYRAVAGTSWECTDDMVLLATPHWQRALGVASKHSDTSPPLRPDKSGTGAASAQGSTGPTPPPVRQDSASSSGGASLVGRALLPARRRGTACSCLCRQSSLWRPAPKEASSQTG